ncbi:MULTISPECIES: SDR family oxidoreductase [unclassified Rhizobium]|uniref:SDR family oxidoreductase n=1 Tax=unclassified Rhizobium TaxID=2613769 RepID=UPI000647C3DA|nr:MULTISPECIES: SDR family oxidoreductase [unclassified Rhizobium]MBN8954676.1 SDR family oxidoreductase [Rhizobium tropici]OJY75455.1 MAG: short-chain dehydrogenase [Rhizobium sp. 60-20]RKD70524.1 NAD(P)-dependent dehydrogenase (short-subunit alcohol dehydrogenase family) [Rhizobium sp. WW_1]
MQTSTIQTGNTQAQSFHGQNVVIIGGSSGIGLATAKQAKEAGANLFLLSRNAERLRDAADAIGGAVQVVSDIAAPQPSIFAGIDRIDHLLITAGTVHLQPLKDQSEADLSKVITERLIGPLLAIKAALPLLHGASSITMTSGQFASRPAAIGAVVAAAIAAVESTVRALALELSPMRINAISPGWVDTPLLDGLMGEAKRQVLEQTASTLPSRNIGRPEDIAQAILFLMANRFVTGEVLHIDGGGRLV